MYYGGKQIGFFHLPDTGFSIEMCILKINFALFAITHLLQISSPLSLIPKFISVLWFMFVR